MTQHTKTPISLYTKVWVSALIFLSIVMVGGLTILAATNLDELKAGANGHTLTSHSWDSLIDVVKTQNTALGVGLDQLETGLAQFNQTLINLFGSRDEKVRIWTVNESCSAGTAGALRDNNWCLEYCNGSARKSISCATYDQVPLRTIIATYGADQTTMNADGWALCNGSSISSQVPWAAIAGNTPNLAGKTLVGAGTSNSATFTAGNDNYYTYGGTTYYGEVRHALTLNEMPGHKHNAWSAIYYGNRTNDDSGGLWSTYAMGNVNGWSLPDPSNFTASAWWGQAHNNMPPFYVIQYYMKVKKTAN